MKKIRVAVVGFGRIGRTFSRLVLDSPTIELVAIHDLYDPATMAHLFRYDSVHGKWNGKLEVMADSLIFNGHRVAYFSKQEHLPWNELGIDVLLESSGTMKTRTDAEKHLMDGAKKVVLSAPPEDESIKTIVLGVNDQLLEGSDTVVSNASCTTNNAAPMIHLLNQAYGINSCYITTVHSYTGDQRLHDAPHKDWRRGRAAAESIVPTTTGAAKALTRIFPDLAGSMGGCGIRVPVPDGSLTDITCSVRHRPTREEVNELFRTAASTTMKGILEYTEDPIVSRDVIGNPHSCIFDSLLTSVIGDMVKTVGWYDNEVGYSNRLVDLIQKMEVHQA